MNDEIPLEAPPMDDEGPGVDVNTLPQPAPGTKPGRNLASSAKPAGGKPASSGPSNMPPVGDIQLKKKSGTYNTYNIQLSYGQIEAIRKALESTHANPIGDELKALFDYYISTIPGPGEEEEDVKAREEQAAIGAGHAAAAGDDDSPLPMPPGEEDDGRITVAGEGEDEDFQDAPDAELPEPPAAMPDMSGGDDFGGGGEDFGADDRLPPPPAE